MNRRTFVNTSLLAFSALPFRNIDFSMVNKPSWILEWIKIHDKQLLSYQKYKVTQKENKYVGGYMDDAELPNPHSTSAFIGKACMLWSCKESVYFNQSNLIPEIEEALASLLKMQHSDGTIDLLSTNFHSTPDTAFVLENIIPAYRFISAYNQSAIFKIQHLLKQFIIQAGEALTVGGIHTPNHRWVVCASLTRINELFPNEKYIKRINQWLAEHIDLDPDGQYTEKSTNGYSPIVNRSLITMSDGLNKPELLEAVKKNLIMTFYYVHPNGEVVTEASNRQDKGTIGNMHKYYHIYRYMALKFQDGTMASMCRLIEKTSTPEQLAGFLDIFLEDPGLWQELPPSKPLPTKYSREFPYSGVVRIRRENWDCTLLSNNTSWLTFHKGNAVLQAMRVATSFFGKGQFQANKILKNGNDWILQNELEGPYYQPLDPEKISPDGDLEKMPRTLRKQSEIQKLSYKVTVREHQLGIEMEFDLSGTEGVPVSLELIFRPGGVLSGVNAIPNRKDAYLFSGQEGTYTLGNDKIAFSKGLILHKGVQLRGALPAMDAPTVYITGITPFKHQIKLS
jgi:hypothetical protein